MHEMLAALNQLARTGRQLATVSGSAKLYETIFEYFFDGFACSEAAVYLTAADAGSLIFAAGRIGDQFTDTGAPLPIGQGLRGRAAETGETQVVTDTIAEEQDGMSDSEAAVPLIHEGEVIGVLHAVSRTRKFREADIPVFTIFGELTAAAVAAIRLRERLNERSHKLSCLTKAGRVFSSCISLEEHLSGILDSLQDALQPEGCEIRLLTEDGMRLSVAASAGAAKAPSANEIPRDKGLWGFALSTGRPSLLPPPPDNRPASPGPAAYLSEMALPLMTDGKALGVLHLFHSKKGRFDESAMMFAGAFADLAANAVRTQSLCERLRDADVTLGDNVKEMTRLNTELSGYSQRIVRINEDLESQLKNLTTIHEAGKAITSSLDLDTTLSAILEMTGQIIGSTAGAIKLLDDEGKEFRTRAQSGSLTDVSSASTIIEVPLQIAEKQIGIFELVCKARNGVGRDEQQMVETLASQAAIAIENARLFSNTQQIYYDTLKSLAQALEARDDYTRGHSERVARIAKLTAVEMGLPAEELQTVESAARLHDIGKIGIRDEVLLAPRKLTDLEMTAIQEHSAFGNTILAPLKFLGKIRECVRHHHERWDGCGYPDGLKGEEIPSPSRIIAVADTYDAMTSDRPYRESRSHAFAVEEIQAQSGVQFDPTVVSAFLALVARIGREGLTEDSSS